MTSLPRPSPTNDVPSAQRPFARVAWPLAAALVLADCASKRAVEAVLPAAGASRPVLGGIVRFTLAYNQGAAFSSHFGPYQRWVLVALTLGVLVALGRWAPHAAAAGRAALFGVTLVGAGAVGNLLDRLASDRGVVDFIDVGVGATRFYVFNVADVCVTAGGALLAYAIWRTADRPLAESPPRP